MAMWRWMVEHTAEHTPGPWESGDGTGQLDGLFVVYSRLLEGAAPMVAVVRPSATCPVKPVAPAVWSQDREAECNALLIADAPHMLELLAQVAEQIEAAQRRPVPNQEKWNKLYVAVCDLLRRHVRIGVAQVDDQNHAPPRSAADAPGGGQ